jgi:hypothetical protein
LDFNTLSNGDLDVASIATWKGSANLFVTKLYDQSGNSIDLGQIAAAAQPAFTLSGLGTLPIMTLSGSQNMSVPSTIASVVQPFSVNAVARRTGNTGAYNFIFWTGSNMQFAFSTTPGVLRILEPAAVNFLSPPATENFYHSINCAFNGASSRANVDGGPFTTGILNGNTGANQAWFLGDYFGGGYPLTGQVLETGIWPSDASGSFVTLNSNQHAYWFPSTYSGPGDIVASAAAWWGLRAYSRITVGNATVRLRRDSDNAEQDFGTLLNGSLDTASITIFKGSANLFITKWYDQTGNANDSLQATAANQPQLLLAGPGGQPNVLYRFNQWTTCAAYFPVMPWSASWVSFNANAAGAGLGVLGSGAATPQITYEVFSTSDLTCYTGVSIYVYNMRGVWAAAQYVHPGGAGASMNANGQVGTGTDTAVDFAAPVSVGQAGGHVMNGYIPESGFWPKLFSSTEITNLQANQRAYWKIFSVTYIGPGDIVPGATGWWGLRAYKGALVGTKCVRLRRDSDNTESDFNTLLDGTLDTASITTFKGSANLFVTKLYDQSVNGPDLVQVTMANQPSFTLNGLGSLPIMSFAAASSTALSATSPGVTIAQPFSVSAVARSSPTNTGKTIWGTAGPNNQMQFSAANQVMIYTGTALIATAADNTYHALGGLFNSTSSDMNVDGTPTTGDAGTQGLSNSVVVIGAWGGGGGYMDGQILEVGVWPSNIDSSFAALSTNQHTYWGF